MKRVLCVILAMILTASCTVLGYAAPGLKAKVTQENVLALLDEYDPDDAFVIRTVSEQGDDITRWFKKGNSILDGLDTCVHEECHSICSTEYEEGFGLVMYFYLGNGRRMRVPQTSFFRTKEMAKSVPKQLRTMRYKTYVDSRDENLGANAYGIYGLLDEFNAYCRGMCVSVAMFDYLRDEKAPPSAWLKWYSMCENDRLAFAEFRYYILFYLDYAKQHHPDAYTEILRNQAFIECFDSLEKTFYQQIESYSVLLDEACSFLKAQHHFVRKGDASLTVGLTTMYGFTDDYNDLITACLAFNEEAQALRAGDCVPAETSSAEGQEGFSLFGIRSWLQDKWTAIREAAEQFLSRAKEGIEETFGKIRNRFADSSSEF